MRLRNGLAAITLLAATGLNSDLEYSFSDALSHQQMEEARVAETARKTLRLAALEAAYPAVVANNAGLEASAQALQAQLVALDKERRQIARATTAALCVDAPKSDRDICAALPIFQDALDEADDRASELEASLSRGLTIQADVSSQISVARATIADYAR